MKRRRREEEVAGWKTLMVQVEGLGGGSVLS